MPVLVEKFTKQTEVKTIQGMVTMPQLDCFVGEVGWVVENDLPVAVSGNSAREDFMDEYLMEYGQRLGQIVAVVNDADVAWELIHYRRNERKDRSRLAAASDVAEAVTPFGTLKKAIRKEGYSDSLYLDIRLYNPRQAWVWYKGEFTGGLVEINQERLWFGVGDGYNALSDFSLSQNGKVTSGKTPGKVRKRRWHSHLLSETKEVVSSIMAQAVVDYKAASSEDFPYHKSYEDSYKRIRRFFKPPTKSNVDSWFE